MEHGIWTFMEFVTLGGRGVISQWVEKELEIESEIEFHTKIRLLAVTPRNLWTRPDFAPFDTEIGEIRFRSNSLQHRVFGFFLTNINQYILVIGSKKKGRIYDPKDAIETARKRRKLIESDRSQLREYTDYKF